MKYALPITLLSFFQSVVHASFFAGTNMTTVLSSLEYYDQLVASYSSSDGGDSNNNITRRGNLQVIPFQEGSHDEIAICNLAVVLPFREGVDGEFLTSYFEYAASIALAVHHLNTGDTSIVKDLQGLPDRCNIRFTLEWFDTSFSQLHAVDEVIRATDRPHAPCAFLGAMRSAVSMPTATITGEYFFSLCVQTTVLLDSNHKS